MADDVRVKHLQHASDRLDELAWGDEMLRPIFEDDDWVKGKLTFATECDILSGRYWHAVEVIDPTGTLRGL